MILLSSVDFSKTTFSKKNQEDYQTVKIVWVLIWVQTVCKGYQHTTSKKRVRAAAKFEIVYLLQNFGGTLFKLKL